MSSWLPGEPVNESALWNQIFQKSAAFTVRHNGTDYEAFAGSTGKIAYGGSGDAGGADGGNADVVIQAALDGLTVGRTSKEKVLCLGNFTIDASIALPAYSILEVNGRITWDGADALASYMFDSTAGNTALVGGYYDGGNKAGTIYNHDGAGAASNFKIAGTYMTNIKQLGAFITVWNTTNGVITGNYFYGNEKGLGVNLWDGVQNVAVSSNTFQKTYDSAVSIGSTGVGILCNNISVTGNTAIGYTSGNGMGISVFGKASNITITGNTILDQALDGINAITDGGFTPDNVCVAGNVVGGSVRHGVNIQSTNSLVTGNIVRDCTDTGIWVSGDDCAITSNFVRGCTNSGIYIYDDTDYCVVVGNVSRYNDYGINVCAGSDKTNVVGNNLLNNTTAAFLDNGTNTVDEHNVKV